MPKTTWLTGEALKVERAKNRAYAAKAREGRKAACPNVNKLKSGDSAHSADRCRFPGCYAQLSFTSINGALVALDWGTLRRHRHQDGLNGRTAGDNRVVT